KNRKPDHRSIQRLRKLAWTLARNHVSAGNGHGMAFLKKKIPETADARSDSRKASSHPLYFRAKNSRSALKWNTRISALRTRAEMPTTFSSSVRPVRIARAQTHASKFQRFSVARMTPRTCKSLPCFHGCSDRPGRKNKRKRQSQPETVNRKRHDFMNRLILMVALACILAANSFAGGYTGKEVMKEAAPPCPEFYKDNE